MPDADRSLIRVLRVITRLNIGGPSIQAMTLSDRLTARGYETKLVHGAHGEREGDMRYLLPPTVDARYLPKLARPVAPVRDAAVLAGMLRIIRTFRPHIVHTHLAKAGTLARVAVAIHNRTTWRSEHVCAVHTYHGHVLDGYFSPRTAKLFVRIERQLARVTDRLVAISPHIQQELFELHAIGRAAQYRVVPLGFDLDPFTVIDDRRRREARAALGLGESARVVTTVGRLTAIKQHDLFIATAALVAEHNPSAVFLVAGDGELRDELTMRVREAGLASRVQFLGWRRDLAAIYAASDVFLLTSRNEGTPVALIESLASGVPSVSTDVGGVRDVIESEAIGLLAPFGDARALAAHVGSLLSEPARRRSMGERGRTLVVARYGIDRLVDDIDRLYCELLS